MTKSSIHTYLFIYVYRHVLFVWVAWEKYEPAITHRLGIKDFNTILFIYFIYIFEYYKILWTHFANEKMSTCKNVRVTVYVCVCDTHNHTYTHTQTLTNTHIHVHTVCVCVCLYVFVLNIIKFSDHILPMKNVNL